MEGSMRGSGIYATEETMNMWCPECHTVVAVDVYINDWYVGFWTCPVCVTEYEMATEDFYDYGGDEYDRANDR